MQTVSAPAAGTFDEEKLGGLIATILKDNATLASLKGMGERELEAVYALGYNLYQQGKYEQACDVFRVGSVYNHLDRRFWKGLGGAHQMLKEHEAALQAYAMTALLDMEDAETQLHAGLCLIALGRKKEAQSALEAALQLASDPQHAQIKARAEMLLETVRGKNARKKSGKGAQEKMRGR